MNLPETQTKAEEIKLVLAPYCHRIEIAGSIRRLKPEGIKDIEIVAQINSRWLREIENIVNCKWGRPAIGKFPSKYTRIRHWQYPIDFFWCFEPATWGLLFFIRTGPAPYVARALSVWKRKSGGGYSEGCLLYDGQGTHYPTPKESDVFARLGWPWVEPQYRLAILSTKGSNEYAK